MAGPVDPFQHDVVQPSGLVSLGGSLKFLPAFLGLVTLSSPDAHAEQRFECSVDVVACVKKAQKACPRNVIFIADRNAASSFSVFTRGTPLNERTIKGRPMLVICTPR